VDKTEIKAAAVARRHTRHPVQASIGRTARHPLAAGFRPASVALALAAAFVPYGDVLAQPAGAQVIHGQASLQQQGNSLLVTTQNGPGSRHSAINWQSFSVPGGSVTHFRQPDAGSTSINRVVGNNPSAIFGTLSSNGRLVVVNPSGIAVGAGAVVDTAGFTASTLRMSDADALAGRLMFAGGDAGALKVDGTVIARQGDAVFIAPQVKVGSAALVQAPNGATLLAAGQSVEVTGRGLEGIRLHVQAPADRAVNLGTLQGDAVAIFAGQLQHSGLVQASGVTIDGGKVVLKAAGLADIGGTVTATQGDKGGQVHATAEHLVLRNGALVDVSGRHGGGEALLGGGWQGKDARVANAQRTTIEAGARVKADAIASGDGGTIVAWSDGATRVQGALSARGGVGGGDGGRIETSGHYLDMRGQVDTRAPNGRAGSLLLDPTNVFIADDSAKAVAAGMALDSPTLDGAIYEPGTSKDSQVTVSSVKGWLDGGTSVTIKTSGTGLGEGNIVVVEPISWSSSGAPTLDLIADNDILLNESITGAGTSGTALGLTAGRDIRQDLAKPSAISVPMLRAAASTGVVSLTHPGNNVGAVAGAGATGFEFVNAAALQVGTVDTAAGSSAGVTADPGSNVRIEAADGLSITADISGNQVLLKTTGPGASVTQSASGAVSASTLTVNAAGDVDLSLAGNEVGTLAGRAGGAETNHSFKFSNSGSLTIGASQDGGAVTVKGIEASFTDRTAGGQIVLKASGSLTQTVDGDLRGSEVFAEGTSVDLTTAVAMVGPDTFASGNTTGIVAGSATAVGGGFAYKSHNPILVSTVKGMEALPGISADGGVTLTSPEGVNVDQAITGGSVLLQATGVGKDVWVSAGVTATAGGIAIEAGRDVDFIDVETLAPLVSSTGGPITVTAGKDGSIGAILGAARFQTVGGPSGSVTLHAQDNVGFGSITTTAEEWGDSGGAVTVTSVKGSIDGNDIHAVGAVPGEVGPAGDGGVVTLNALAGSVTVRGDVDIHGGSGAEAQGGDGGKLIVDAALDIKFGQRPDTVSLGRLGRIDVRGGDSWSGESAVGGNAGLIDLNSTGGAVDVYAAIDGYGGIGDARGGHGATVTISGAGAVTLGGSFQADGGQSYGGAGPGGNGGEITIEAGSGFTFSNYISAIGGYGSNIVNPDVPDVPQGRGGTIAITQQSGTLLLNSANWIDASGGHGTYGMAARGGDGGAITLDAQTIRLDRAELYANGGAGGTGDGATAGGDGGKGGDIKLLATASVELTGYAAGEVSDYAGLGVTGGYGGDGGTVGGAGGGGGTSPGRRERRRHPGQSLELDGCQRQRGRIQLWS